MATGSLPSAADEALSTTDEKANFQRLTRLLMRGGLALLREVFDSIHPPANFPAVLGNPAVKSNLEKLRRGRVLTHPEWDCLYNPSGPGMFGKSTDFDISLLCKLLREICNLTPPATGWKDLPNITDHSLGADLVRIRIYRNKIYGHNHTMEVTDADFEKLWVEISEALLRIASSISSSKRDEWKNSIEKFFHEPLTPDAKECVDELRSWYLLDMYTKDKLENLDKKIEQMQIKQDQMKIEQEQRHMEILIFLESLKASGSAVSSSAQVEGDPGIPPEQSSAKGTAGLSTLTELQASKIEPKTSQERAASKLRAFASKLRAGKTETKTSQERAASKLRAFASKLRAGKIEPKTSQEPVASNLRAGRAAMYIPLMADASLSRAGVAVPTDSDLPDVTFEGTPDTPRENEKPTNQRSFAVGQQHQSTSTTGLDYIQHTTTTIASLPEHFQSNLLKRKIGEIPIKFYSEICLKLDMRRDFWDDYRSFGEAIGLEKDIVLYLGQTGNPTCLMLEKFDSQEGSSIKTFRDLVKEMGRDDVVSVVEDWIVDDWIKSNYSLSQI